MQGNTMDREIQRELEKYPTKIIEHSTLKTILSKMGYKNINTKISHLKENGILRTLKNSFYMYSSISSKELVSKEIVANTLLGPSYVSLDYALSFYGAIPENVQEITSIATKRKKSFETFLGNFSYTHIKKELFNIGLDIKTKNNISFIIASKEKALCDKVYLTRDYPIRSKRVMLEFLEDDLRVDLDEFKTCDMNIFVKFYLVSKSEKIGILTQIIKDL